MTASSVWAGMPAPVGYVPMQPGRKAEYAKALVDANGGNTVFYGCNLAWFTNDNVRFFSTADNSQPVVLGLSDEATTAVGIYVTTDLSLTKILRMDVKYYQFQKVNKGTIVNPIYVDEWSEVVGKSTICLP